jgi:PTH1 family peptidyl-tRNA hydrolase
MAEAVPWLLVGLGNPGAKYAGHRHNVGFRVAERFVELHGTPGACEWREKFHGRFVSLTGPFGRCIVLEPLTYMNVSGKSVAAAATFHRVPPERMVVAHDEVDFVFGRIAVKKGGGHGGHNGLRDIVAAVGTPEFVRIRVGVGRPSHGEVADWVLADFAAQDLPFVPDLVDRAAQAATAVMTEGVAAAMNSFNQSQG